MVTAFDPVISLLEIYQRNNQRCTLSFMYHVLHLKFLYNSKELGTVAKYLIMGKQLNKLYSMTWENTNNIIGK